MARPISYAFLLAFIVCWRQTPLLGQVHPQRTNIVMHQVPLLISTRYMLDSMCTYAAGHAFYVLPDTVAVYWLPCRRTALATHLYTVAPPLDALTSKKLCYRIVHSNEHTERVGEWIPLLAIDTTGLIYSEFIAAGSRLSIEFSYCSTSDIIERIDVVGLAYLPYLLAFTDSSPMDTVNKRLKAQLIHEQKNVAQRLYLERPMRCTTKAGCYPEFLFKKWFATDSILRYRLLTTAGEVYQDWTKTGHFLSIPTVRIGEETIVEVGYTATGVVERYFLYRIPYWYRTRVFITIVLLVGIGLLLYLGYRYYRYQLQQKQLALSNALQQIAFIQQRLNPHFVYNALSTIQGLVNIDDKMAANAYLSRFSLLMRSTMNNSASLFVRLSDEVFLLEQYLHIEQLRFGFCYSIVVDPTLDIGSISFPPMLLQPSFENAVKHGVVGLKEKGWIVVRCVPITEGFCITIQNNSISTDLPRVQDGNGIQLTKQRIDYLQQMGNYYRIAYRMEFEPGICTVVFEFYY